MQILLANAKIMFSKADRKPVSAPLFQTVADTLAAEMARMDVEELARQLRCKQPAFRKRIYQVKKIILLSAVNKAKKSFA